jgi:hypothetical protein
MISPIFSRDNPLAELGQANWAQVGTFLIEALVDFWRNRFLVACPGAHNPRKML